MDHELRSLLAAAPVPDELGAQRRAWALVHTAFEEREPQRRPAGRFRLLIAVAAVAALAAAALSPPGRAVGDWIRDRVAGEEKPRAALTRLPAPGQLLVVSDRGPWIVRRDGSKRLLGNYDDASWSPSGQFVVVTEGQRLTAVEPDGDPRWQLTRRELLADARWSPLPGFRIAYRAGRTLRVVDGNGTDDRLLARRVAAVAPAWRPRPKGRYVLAFAERSGLVRIADVDAQRELWRASGDGRVRSLAWSGDGRRLLVVTAGNLSVYTAPGRLVRRLQLPRGTRPTAAAFHPLTTVIAYAVVSQSDGVGRVLTTSAQGGSRTVFSGSGALTDLDWSPDGRWLLVGWPDADQWLFLGQPAVRQIVTVEDVRREFDPGGAGAASFPRVTGWCCAP